MAPRIRYEICPEWAGMTGANQLAMLRIHMLAEANSNYRVALEGSIAGPWVEELRRLLAERADSALALDLYEVRFVDAAGEALLRKHLAAGARVARSSPYVAALLQLEPAP